MRAIALAMSAVFRFIGHPFVRTLNALIVRILPILYLIVFMCFVAVVHVSGPTVFIQFPGCEFVFHLRGASPPLDHLHLVRHICCFRRPVELTVAGGQTICIRAGFEYAQVG